MPAPQNIAKQRLLALAAGTPARSSQSTRNLRAHGGKVAGPGTSTSDSIEAKLSADEFVLPADTTRKIGVERLRKLVAATHQPTGKAAKPHHYADGGLVEDEEKQASAAASTASPSRADLIAQIPLEEGRAAPKAQDSGMLDSLKQTEVGRQVYNTAMALPGVGGVGRTVSTGGAISSGLNRLAAIGNAAGNMATGDGAVREAVSMGADFARNFPAGTAQAGTLPDKGASAPVAPSGEQGQPQPDSAGSMPQSGSSIAPGIYQHGRGKYSDSAAGMDFSPGFTGQPSAADHERAGALALNGNSQAGNAFGVGDSRSPVGMSVQDAQAAGLVGERVGYDPAYDTRRQGAGPATARPAQSWSNFANGSIAMESSSSPEQTPQMRSPTLAHSGNDWTARENLRRLKMDATSLAHSSHWAKKGSGKAAADTYSKALLADHAAMTDGQSQANLEAMKVNAGLQREGMAQAGADRRDARRSAWEMGRLGLEAQEQSVRLRGLNRLDQAQEALMKAQNPEQVSSARARLLALHGKSGQEQTRWRSGNDQNGNPFLYNEVTAETRPMAPPAAAQAPAQGSYHRGSDGKQYEFRDGQYVPVGSRK
ncbi:hypothetical protein [Comamonas sp. NoAH]|uniref:hypothetical protein n=1 Tax=Comamonas halotolerans TaxID=3041496 RepID=UPI0024E10AB1|nr:hypothetical protein [Comamonas sp. NoAH]